MRITIIAGLAAICTTAAAEAVESATLYEEVMARQEERLIITTPIAGREDRFWFNYRANVNEASKELAGDLRHASDTEDLRDAWEEYRTELRHERRSYIEEMAERGFRHGAVIVGD